MTETIERGTQRTSLWGGMYFLLNHNRLQHMTEAGMIAYF